MFTSLAGTGLFAYEVTRSRRASGESARWKARRPRAGSRRAAGVPHRQQPGRHPDHHGGLHGAARQLGGPPAVRRGSGGAARPEYPALRAGAGAACRSLGEPHQTFRTEMQCRGRARERRRFSGQRFLFHLPDGHGAAAGGAGGGCLRGACGSAKKPGLEQLMAGSRILVGAVSHEVRNVCGAIGVIYENLVRQRRIGREQGFRSAGLAGGNPEQDRLPGAEAEHRSSRRPSGVDLSEILDDLRIVLEPYCQDAGIEVRWKIPPRTSAGLGRPPPPAAGAAEPHQEQRARAGRMRR